MARKTTLNQWPAPHPMKLRAARKARGLTQLELAVAVGLTPGTISVLERGLQERLQPVKFALIACALKVRAQSLT